MYKIIGTDQKQYGPVNADTLRQWIRERRAIATTMIQAEGSTEWKPLSSFPEFSDALAAAAPAPSPASPEAFAPRPGAATGMPYGAPTTPYAPMPPKPTKTSGLAISSLVLGILGWLSCGLTSLFGLLCGIIGLVKINKSQGQVGGKGLAIAGIVLSGVTIIMLPFLAAMLLPAVAKSKNKAQDIICVSNLKQLGLAIRFYAEDNKQKLPRSANWCDAIQSTAGSTKIFVCPASASGQRCTYAYNVRLSGLDVNKVNPQTVMLFEVAGGWNSAGGPESMISRPRHTFYNFCFADGSVRQVPPTGVQNLRWNP